MTDKTISVYWFFILFIIASAIVFIVYTMYGTPLDIRGAEGIFLAEKMADCVSQGGKLTEKGEILIKEGNNGNLKEVCNLNFDVEPFKEKWKNDQFFVSITFSIVEGDSLLPIIAGNSNLNSPEYNINFIDSNRKKFPFCVDRTMFSNGEGEKYYSIKIIACVRKTEKNV